MQICTYTIRRERNSGFRNKRHRKRVVGIEIVAVIERAEKIARTSGCRNRGCTSRYIVGEVYIFVLSVVGQ